MPTVSFPTKLSLEGRKSGHPGNLNVEQTQNLKDLWARILPLFEQSGEEIQPKTETDQEIKPKKSGSIFSLSSKKEEPAREYFLGATSDPRWMEWPLEKAIPMIPGALLRESFWGLVATSNPDAILLRYLRARRWDTNAAYFMLMNTLRWRIYARINEIVALGETGLVDTLESAKEGLGMAVKAQLDRKIVTLGGPDKKGRGVCFVNVQVHNKDNQSLEAIKLMTIHIMETSRIVSDYPMDAVCIVFNLENFTLSNMDFEAIKFLVGCFQAYYPETLGMCCVHKAPWVFSKAWNLVTPILDPVVASKIIFTKTIDELQNYIDEDCLPIIASGNKDKPSMDDIEAKRKPIAGQYPAPANDARIQHYWQTVKEYESSTKTWSNTPTAIIEEQTMREKDALDRLRLAQELRSVRLRAEKVFRGETGYHAKGLIKLTDEGRLLICYNTNTWKEKDVTEWV
ncbi:CRAL-TRIO domain-containing protein [Blakeslea trispora]|nr:CRAL-TRIO domain-containing protein [Blakeslea trispora]